MPLTLQWTPDAAGERADRSTWIACHGCDRPIPARADRRFSGDRLGTWSYVCPHCAATQIGSLETDVDAQDACHACRAALGDLPACASCGMLRGWAVVRCPRCGHGQAVCTPHLASMCDVFRLQCVRCEIVTRSLCIC
jgi:hypothetical protein